MTGNRDGAFAIFGSILDVHDLLLIDDRGRGLSGTLGVTNCIELQQGATPWEEAPADCAAEPGNAASRYRTGDIQLEFRRCIDQLNPQPEADIGATK